MAHAMSVGSSERAHHRCSCEDSAVMVREEVVQVALVGVRVGQAEHQNDKGDSGALEHWTTLQAQSHGRTMLFLCLKPLLNPEPSQQFSTGLPLATILRSNCAAPLNRASAHMT